MTTVAVPSLLAADAPTQALDLDTLSSLVAASWPVALVVLAMVGVLYGMNVITSHEEARARTQEMAALRKFSATVHAKYDVVDELIEQPWGQGTTRVIARVGGQVTPCEVHIRDGAVFVFSRTTGVEADSMLDTRS